MNNSQYFTIGTHSDSVWSVCYSPDGKTIASGSCDNTIRIWDAESGQHKATLKGHSDSFISVCYLGW